MSTLSVITITKLYQLSHRFVNHKLSNKKRIILSQIKESIIRFLLSPMGNVNFTSYKANMIIPQIDISSPTGLSCDFRTLQIRMDIMFRPLRGVRVATFFVSVLFLGFLKVVFILFKKFLFIFGKFNALSRINLSSRCNMKLSYQFSWWKYQ